MLRPLRIKLGATSKPRQQLGGASLAVAPLGTPAIICAMPPRRTISIRPAVSTDVPLILALIKELAEYEKLSHEVVATEDLLAQWLFGPDPKAETLIGSIDDQPCGFALFFHSFSTFLAQPGIYLEDLYVQPAMRGFGLGEALLRQLARIAVERGCGRLEWAVLDWNEPAIGFYKKLGALPMDQWTVYRVSGKTLADMAGANSP
jgi:GNAT superfamily N-acetyltransferase